MRDEDFQVFASLASIVTDSDFLDKSKSLMECFSTKVVPCRPTRGSSVSEQENEVDV
jgi:hypothetical protein